MLVFIEFIQTRTVKFYLDIYFVNFWRRYVFYQTQKIFIFAIFLKIIDVCVTLLKYYRQNYSNCSIQETLI